MGPIDEISGDEKSRVTVPLNGFLTKPTIHRHLPLVGIFPLEQKVPLLSLEYGEKSKLL
jgi:hypothetical protein